MAASLGDASIVRVLLDAGARVHADVRSEGSAHLHDAATRGDIQEAKRWLHAGTSIDATDSYDRTALMWACWAGQTDVAKSLCDAGAALELRADGWTALRHAVVRGHVALAKVLLSRGAKPESAVDWAASYGPRAMLELPLSTCLGRREKRFLSVLDTQQTVGV